MSTLRVQEIKNSNSYSAVLKFDTFFLKNLNQTAIQATLDGNASGVITPQQEQAAVAEAAAAAVAQAEQKVGQDLADVDNSDDTVFGIQSPFVDPATCNVCQLLFLGSVYSYVLFQGSELIASGSELLLLVPSMAELVGSVVLPVLGAVPDSVMVIVSGIGPNASKEIFVGVGTLAGSTVRGNLCESWEIGG